MRKMPWLLAVIAVMEVRGSAGPAEWLTHLPLRFEENRSPTDRDAKFVARGAAYVLSLTPSESRFDWNGPAGGRQSRVRMRFSGARPDARMEAGNRLSGTANYFLGAPMNWRTDVPGFERIRYRNLYPGIDLIFHGEQGRLEYDFVLAPHSDPGAIRLEFKGHQRIVVEPDGDLAIFSSGGEIRWKRPEVYQDSDGGRRPIDGRFVMAGKSAVRFEIAGYDSSRTLEIDPVLAYSTYLGGTGNEFAKAVTVDNSGNVFVAGITSSPNLPVVSALQPAYAGGTANYFTGDAFIAKFTPAGTLVYLTYLGGSGDDGVAGIAVDSADNVYITGVTDSTNFPTVNAFQTTFGGFGGSSFFRVGDAFLAKLNPAGNALLFSTYLGGALDDDALAIAIDANGNSYICGSTMSDNFPTTQGAFQPSFRGGGGQPILAGYAGGDAWVAKFDTNGNRIYATYIGGIGDDLAATIAVDSAGNAYIGGYTTSFDFPTTPGALQTTFGGSDTTQDVYYNFGDAWIAKLNPAGSALIFSTFFGGPGDDSASALTVDLSGNVYFAGITNSENLPTSPGAFQPNYGGYTTLPQTIRQLTGDGYVAKLNSTGTALLYMSYLGGSENDAALGIAIDAFGEAYVTGFTDSPNFPATAHAVQPQFAGDGGEEPDFFFGDAFLTVVNPTGTSLVYSSFHGGTKDDIGFAVAIDGMGKVYMTGNTFSQNFPVVNAIQPKFGGYQASNNVVLGDAFYSVFSGFQQTPVVITSVTNAFGGSTTLAPNTWVAVKGTGLAPDTRIWQASDFVNNQMPTSLDGVTVTLNGVNAYIYYISGTQLNILTPPNLPAGPVQVQVTNSAASPTFAAPSAALSPSLFVFDTAGHVVAQHLPSYMDVGPTSLYPGLTTPAAPGETIALYGTGFGATTVPIVPGSEVQSGTLPGTVQIQVNGLNCVVQFAGLVGPGLYLFDLVLPTSLPNGDLPIVVTYNGQPTQSTAVVTIQQP